MPHHNTHGYRLRSLIERLGFGLLGLILLGWELRVVASPTALWRFLWFDQATLLLAGIALILSAAIGRGGD